MECSKLDTSLNILNGFYYDELHKRIMWVYREALQREEVRISNGDRKLRSNGELMMLFLWEFLDLYMDAANDSEVGTHDGNSDICTRNTSLSLFHRSVKVSNREWKLTTNLGPQDIWIEIRTEPDI